MGLFQLAAQDRERREQERERERQHVRNEAQPLLAAAQAQGNSDVSSSTSGPVSAKLINQSYEALLDNRVPIFFLFFFLPEAGAT